MVKTTFRGGCLNEEGRRRRSRKIPRESLVHPIHSPWHRLYRSKNDQALITVTGFDHVAFRIILRLFAPVFNDYTPWTGDNDGRTYKRLKRKGGKQRLISAHACLGLTLSWYRFRGAEYVIQGWFGFTGTHCNVWLRFGRRILFRVLHKHALARVSFPDSEKIRQYQELVVSRHPALKDVYAVADGLKLYFQQCWDVDEQNKFYNGWQHGHFLSNLFVFGADGRIIKCVLNAPGSCHDSTLCEWGGVYDALNKAYVQHKGKVCVDSAFKATGDFLIKSSEDYTLCEMPEELRIAVQATALRQSAEWGMRAIQGAFPRMKDKIKYEEVGERRVTLQLLPLLYNIRLELVGLNQLRNVYAPQLSKDSSSSRSVIFFVVILHY